MNKFGSQGAFQKTIECNYKHVNKLHKINSRSMSESVTYHDCKSVTFIRADYLNFPK